MTMALALDGPFNGEYINEVVAGAAGYVLTEWQPGEEAWLHTSGTLRVPEELSEEQN